MDFKSIDVLTSVGTNFISEADNTVAKAVLTAEELIVKNNTSILIAGLSIATNIGLKLIPEEWTLATQVVDKLDLADVVEYTDIGADIALAGSVISIGMNAKKIYNDLACIDKMSPEELKQFLAKRSDDRFKPAIEDAEVVSK